MKKADFEKKSAPAIVIENLQLSSISHQSLAGGHFRMNCPSPPPNSELLRYRKESVTKTAKRGKF
ncbi:MAG: hypothetical protein WBA89_00345 [Microcoleus sp.]|uniref:hypothetical protein n=1 Tax=Microcoleus sp. TaxID=44472 RepID=UPI003C74AEE0